MKQIDRASWIRTGLAALAILNHLLIHFGYEPVPEAMVSTFVDFLYFAISILLDLAALWAVWKNNYLSRKGIAQKEVLQQHHLTK